MPAMPDVLTIPVGTGRSGPVSGAMQGGAVDSPGHRRPRVGAGPGRPVTGTGPPMLPARARRRAGGTWPRNWREDPCPPRSTSMPDHRHITPEARAWLDETTAHITADARAIHAAFPAARR